MSKTPSKELVLLSDSAPNRTLDTGERQILNPLIGLRKLRERRAQEEQERIKEMCAAVIKKLCTGITEKGMVSLFHDKDTGNVLQTEMYSAIFSSEALPHLGVMVYRDHRPNDGLWHRHELSLSMIEHDSNPMIYRSLSIERSDGMPEGDFKLRFAVGGTDEGHPEIQDKSRLKVISPKQKIQFLEDILATEVDTAQTEKKFGAPYTPGGVRPSMPDEKDVDFVYSGYWVRDIAHRLSALPGVAPQLTAAPTSVVS